MKTSKYLSRPLVAVCAFITLLFISSAAAQNVGIRVSNPQSKLTVNGSTASGGIAVGDSTFNVPAPANGAIIQGSVGIGHTAPVTALDVNHGTALVNAIQEVKREKDSEITKLQAENASQRAELGQLSRQIAKLKTENAKLTAIVSKVENLEKAVTSLQLKTDIKPVALAH